MRPALRLVGGSAEPVEYGWFCGHCAAPSPRGLAPAPTARVCASCGLGLLLETRADQIPRDDDAFLVVDSSLAVQALSEQAEKLLAVNEEDAINRPISELLVPADAEAHELGFAAALVDAASGLDELATGIVRPWNTFGVRMRVRIAPCGPPRAALIVLDARRQARLRLIDA